MGKNALRLLHDHYIAISADGAEWPRKSRVKERKVKGAKGEKGCDSLHELFSPNVQWLNALGNLIEN